MTPEWITDEFGTRRWHHEGWTITVWTFSGPDCEGPEGSDLDYDEDSSAEIDMNLVMTGRGKIIEVQATAEKMPVTRDRFAELLDLGITGIQNIVAMEKKIIDSRNI